MKKMINPFKTALSFSLLTVLHLTYVHASTDDESYSSYDEIIRSLSSSSSTTAVSEKTNTQDLIRFHGGIALVNSRLNLNVPSTLPDAKNLKGYEFHLGIDLFSKNWIALGALRSFDPENFGSGNLQMREFDLSVHYQNKLKIPLLYTIGAGITSRYIDISGHFQESFNKSSTTPASIIHLGIDAPFFNAFSLGLSVSYRSALVSDSIDDGGIDGGLKISGQF